MKPTAFLNFEALTDPLCLLEALIVHRATHEKLLVRESNLNIFADFGQPPGLVSGDIRDNSLFKYIGNKNDLSIKSNNLPLALRIAQFAIKSGYIEIVSDPKIPESEIIRITSSPVIQKIYKSLPTTFWYDYYLVGTVDWPATRNSIVLGDLWVAVARSSHLITGSRDNNLQEKVDNIFPKNQADHFREIVSNLAIDNISDIWNIIERPKIFLKTIDAVISSIERNIHSDLLLFLSRAYRSTNYQDLIGEVWQRSINITINEGDTYMTGSSKYAISGGQQGAVGDNAKSFNFTQVQDPSDIHDFDKLVRELETLEKQLEGMAKTQAQHETVNAIAQAKKAAESGKKIEVSRYLKKAGQWALDVATNIGARVAAAAIKTSIGL